MEDALAARQVMAGGEGTQGGLAQGHQGGCPAALVAGQLLEGAVLGLAQAHQLREKRLVLRDGQVWARRGRGVKTGAGRSKRTFSENTARPHVRALCRIAGLF